MSLIKCPECGAERVSSLAAACPHCGFPVAEYLKSEAEAKKEQELNEAKKQMATITYLCSGDGHKTLRILKDGHIIAMIDKGTTGEIVCKEPVPLLFFMNDEVFANHTLEPGHDYNVELHIYNDRLPEFTFNVNK